MENQINLQSLGCTPDKKVPTHGPGATAYYRGKQCKILSIKNGKAKIFCDDKVLLVNYTSLDDAMYGTMHEAYRVVDNKTHKALFTGTKDECKSFIANECDEDADVKCIELKESITVPSNAMDKTGYTLGEVISDLKGPQAAQFASNPVLCGIATLQRNYFPVWDYDYDLDLENKDFKRIDKDIRSKFHKILEIPDGRDIFEIYTNKNNTEYLVHFIDNDNEVKCWYVPASGKINEGMPLNKTSIYKSIAGSPWHTETKRVVCQPKVTKLLTKYFGKECTEIDAVGFKPFFNELTDVCKNSTTKVVSKEQNKEDVPESVFGGFGGPADRTITVYKTKSGSIIIKEKDNLLPKYPGRYFIAYKNFNESLRESITVPSGATDGLLSLEQILSSASSQVAAAIATNPLLYGISVLQRKYVAAEETDPKDNPNPAYTKLDKAIRAKYHKLMSVPSYHNYVFEVYANKDYSAFLIHVDSPYGGKWFVPKSGNIDESVNVDKIQSIDESVTFPKILQTDFTMQDLVNKFPELVQDPLTYGIAVLQRKYVGNFIGIRMDIPRPDPNDPTLYNRISNQTMDEFLKKFKFCFRKQLKNGEYVIIYVGKNNPNNVVLEYESKKASAGIGHYVFLPSNGVLNESEAQDKYQEFFKKKLTDYGVSSPAELSTDDKTKFFSEIKKEWPDAKVNESLKNKTLFDKIEKWYSALTVDQKENLFYNMFRFSGQSTKMAKKYKTLAQFVKMGTKNTPESADYKHTGVGVANAIATYYQSFKNEKDIMPKLASIKMDNSKDYLKYHEIAKGTTLNESEMAFGIGSTVCFKGNNCKIVSIANGKCKLVCDGKVLYASMDELLPVNPINEAYMKVSKAKEIKQKLEKDPRFAKLCAVIRDNTTRIGVDNAFIDIYEKGAKQIFKNLKAVVMGDDYVDCNADKSFISAYKELFTDILGNDVRID